MVVHKPGCLHERIADGRPDKSESALFQILRKGVRFRSACGQAILRSPRISFWAAIDESPDILVKAAEVFLDSKKRTRVCKSGFDLQPIADNSRIRQQPGDRLLVKASDLCGIELRECSPVSIPFLEDGVPTEAGLGAFQNKELEKPVVVVNRHAPLVIVVADRELVAGPGAARTVE